MKLTTRFLLILISIAVFPLLISLAWNIYQYSSASKSFFELHKSIVKLGVSNIQEWLIGVDRNFAFLYEIESPLYSRKIDEVDIIKQATKINSQIAAISFIDRNNKELFNMKGEDVNINFPLYEINSELIKKARETQTIALGDIVCFNKPFFPAAYPLIDGRVVLFYFPVEKLWDKLNSQKIGQTGKIFIVNDKGIVLPCQKISIKDIDSEYLAKTFKNGASTDIISSLTIDGKKYVGAYSAEKKLKWVIVSVQSDDEVYGGQRKSIILFISFAIITFIISLIIVFLISSRIIKPINNMSEAVKSFLKEQVLEKVIPQEGWPEIKNLVSILNRLMLELQAYRAFQLNQIMEEKNKAQVLIDTIPDGVLLLDNRNSIIYANITALKLLGINTKAQPVILPRSITNEIFAQEFEKLLSKKDKFTKIELDSPSIDNKNIIKSYRVISSQFMLATLKKPGRIIIIRDITSEKEVEKAKEDFFHMITHDMRAPLSTIQGYIEILHKKFPSSPSTDKYFQNILYSSKKLRGMIDDILNTTKLERGTMTLQLDKVSAKELINRVRDNHVPVALPKNINLKVENPEPDFEFYCDPALIERVITNLVGNSLKFTPQGGEITIGASSDENFVTIWVKDTGPGIPDDKKEMIFEKYSQMEEHKSQGFGLGLAMCKMTVELHKGKIWVESELGKGSKFIFTISKSLKPEEKSEKK